jgi:hypothetical protein
MDHIFKSPYTIPRFSHGHELATIDPIMFRSVSPFQLEDPLGLVAELIIERFRNDALQDGLVRQAAPKEPAPTPELKPPGSSDFAAMEKRIIAAISGRRPDGKPEPHSPFLKRKEAIELLKTRSTLERCEKVGWLKATTRQPRLVLYKRADVMACVHRLSQGEYPST